MPELRVTSSIEYAGEYGETVQTYQGCDLLRNAAGELFLVDALKAGEFIRENPLFSIVGIGLSREATDTPYGKIGAVLE